MEIAKSEVEELLKCEVSNEVFEEALAYAKKKQQYTYETEKRAVIMQHWYLVKLTEECVRALVFSRYTMGLCEMLRNMEKSTRSLDTSAPTATIL